MYGLEWLELAARWFHVIAGIAWIGTSFYFNWLNDRIAAPEEPRPGIAGELWSVHGGGFYRSEKFAVAPERLPHELHWFKWEAYGTWLSGAALLVLVYYLGAEAYLVERGAAAIGPGAAIAVGAGTIVGGWLLYDALCRTRLVGRPRAFATIGFVLATAIAFGLSQVLSGRAAYIHVGAMLGTIMAANVFFIIIPAHRDLVRAVEEGREPDAARGVAGARRSLHNNYLTLPVVFTMISNHYPITYAHPYGWLILAALGLIGAWTRHWFNLRNRGRAPGWILPAAAVAMIAVAALAAPRGPVGARAGPAGSEVDFEEVRSIIATRCAVCHSADPVLDLFPAAPGGIAFDSAEEIRARAEQIRAVTVESRVMPLGNLTDMTEGERERIGRWAESVGEPSSDQDAGRLK